MVEMYDLYLGDVYITENFGIQVFQNKKSSNTQVTNLSSLTIYKQAWQAFSFPCVRAVLD